jgi:hypothetical protein
MTGGALKAGVGMEGDGAEGRMLAAMPGTGRAIAAGPATTGTVGRGDGYKPGGGLRMGFGADVSGVGKVGKAVELSVDDPLDTRVAGTASTGAGAEIWTGGGVGWALVGEEEAGA